MQDNFKNFAYSVVGTAPSPPLSGTSLVLVAGGGAQLPAAPFNATVWPSGQQPLYFNAEVVRVTAKSGDTLTISRAQEGSNARAIQVGDQIAATITAKVIADVRPLTGEIKMWPLATAPTDGNWVLCDGGSYLRTDPTYAGLFALIGITFGAVDGTHFSVPDLRGRVPVGVAPGGKAAVDAVGDSDGLAEALRNISHHHVVASFSTAVSGPAGGAVTQTGTQSTSGDGDNTDEPAYLVVNFIIHL